MFDRLFLFIFAILSPFTFNSQAMADGLPPSTPADVVRQIVAAPVGTMDFARAKLMIDRIADPSGDDGATLAELERMTAAIKQMIATLPPEAQSSSMERMRALRAFLYQPGDWNDNRPFTYDLEDPYGKKVSNQLLATYLKSRIGNCISMPILFLILGERIGLNVTLSATPLHMFVKWTSAEDGTTYNLEATSGAGAIRDVWYRQQMPMTDLAITNGVYLKALPRKEALSLMATPVLDDLLQQERYDDAIAVADVLVELWPANAHALVKKGTAYYRLLQRDIVQKYSDKADIPVDKLDRANALYRANKAAFDQAIALGWEPAKQ